MSQTPISREIALRIGIAARMLPDTDPARLLKVLADAVGLPPTEESLSRLKVKPFKAAADGELAEMSNEQLKDALAVLKGEAHPDETKLPELQAYAEGDMPGSLRVACASNNGEELDGHFGSCRRFLIYQVSKDEARLIDLRTVGKPEGDMEKNEYRASLIDDCQLLFVNSIGGPAAAKVVKKNVHPIKHPNGGRARDKIDELTRVLQGAPPPWLAKVMGQEASTLSKFAEEAVE